LWGIKKVPLTLCLQCSFTPANIFFQYLLAHSWIENQPVNRTDKPSSQVSKPSAIFLQHLTKAASWQCGYSAHNACPKNRFLRPIPLPLTLSYSHNSWKTFTFPSLTNSSFPWFDSLFEHPLVRASKQASHYNLICSNNIAKKTHTQK
jgi:hypothetical protein